MLKGITRIVEFNDFDELFISRLPLLILGIKNLLEWSVFFLENGDFSYTLEPAASISPKTICVYVRLVAVSYRFVNVHRDSCKHNNDRVSSRVSQIVVMHVHHINI